MVGTDLLFSVTICALVCSFETLVVSGSQHVRSHDSGSFSGTRWGIVSGTRWGIDSGIIPGHDDYDDSLRFASLM